MVTIDIYSKSTGVFRPFIKANSYLINKYKNSKLKLISEDFEFENKKLYETLKKLWIDEYGIFISDDWKTITFSSNQHYEMFLLRWI